VRVCAARARGRRGRSCGRCRVRAHSTLARLRRSAPSCPWSSPVFGQNFDTLPRLIFFVVAENVIIAIKIALGAYINNSTVHTELQLKRQEFLVQRHIFGVDEAALPAQGRRAAALMRAATAGLLFTPDAVGRSNFAPVRPAHTYATMLRHAAEADGGEASL